MFSYEKEMKEAEAKLPELNELLTKEIDRTIVATLGKMPRILHTKRGSETFYFFESAPVDEERLAAYNIKELEPLVAVPRKWLWATMVEPDPARWGRFLGALLVALLGPVEQPLVVRRPFEIETHYDHDRQQQRWIVSGRYAAGGSEINFVESMDEFVRARNIPSRLLKR